MNNTQTFSGDFSTVQPITVSLRLLFAIILLVVPTQIHRFKSNELRISKNFIKSLQDNWDPLCAFPFISHSFPRIFRIDFISLVKEVMEHKNICYKLWFNRNSEAKEKVKQFLCICGICDEVLRSAHCALFEYGKLG